MTTVLVAFLALALAQPGPPRRDCDRLVFDSHGSTLVGCFYAADAPHPHTLVFTQAFFANGDPWGIGKALSQRGVNVFTFEFRGCFESEGKQGLRNSQEDIGSALAFLSSSEMRAKYHVDPARMVLGGHSYGGHMSMLYAVHHPEVGRVISISGGDLGVLARQVRADPDLRKGYSDFFRSIGRPDGPVDFAYEDPMQELLDAQPYFSIADQAGSLSDTDVLMTGGLDDREVSLEDHMLPLYRKLRANHGQGRVRFIVYQTDHSYENVSDRLIADVAAWIDGR
jgi:pimeloyl-ACP methyl ester carboxylesterase